MKSQAFTTRTLPPGLAARLDPLCDQFESDWLAGRRPRLEELLPHVAEADRPALLRELLALELEYRARQGERPTADEYRRRLPEHAAVIEEALSGRSPISVAAQDGPTLLAAQLLPAAPQALASGAPPLRRAGRYEVEGEIARGGMGAVLRARDPDLNRVLAVKVLLERHRGHPELERRFTEEAQVTGQLQHPGVPPVHEVGRLPDGRPFFAMKLIKGRTLAELLKERPAPQHDLPSFLAIFQHVCQTLAYAHNKGVIHRDLKPANVMVGAFGEVQVMDWGLAKVLADQDPGSEGDSPQVSSIATVRSGDAGLSSQAGSVIGTPAYMAPEQARGEVDRLDERCDVFGLGALLCEVLTGQPPYIGPSTAAVRHLALGGDLTATLARLDASGTDAELVGLARACLAPRAEERLANAQAVDQALTAYLAGVQEKLRRAELDRAAAALRAVEERKRRRLTAGLAAALLLLVVAAGGGAWWRQRIEGDHAARQAAQDAERAERRARTEGDVTAALQEAEALGKEARAATDNPDRWQALLSAALSAAKRAEGLLNSGEATDDLRERVGRVRAALDADEEDRTLLAELDDVRLRHADTQAGRVAKARTAERYAAAFRRHGLDVLAVEPEAAAALLRARPAHDVLLEALTAWMRYTPSRDEARKLLRVVQVADPDPGSFRNRWRAALAAKDRDALVTLAAEAGRLALPPASVSGLSVDLRTAGDPDAALRLLREAQRRRPGDFWLNFDLAYLCLEVRPFQREEAVRYYTAAVALRGGTAMAHNNLGYALKGLGRREEAVRCFNAALEIDGRHAFAHYNLGEALSDEGQLDDAAARFRKAIECDPKYTAPHVGLGIVSMRRGQWEPANRCYLDALAIDPTYARALTGLGTVLLIQGKKDEALAYFRKAVDADPNDPGAHLSLGIGLRQKGLLDDAIPCYETAIRLDPRSLVAHIGLGEILMQRGRVDEAVPRLRTAIDLDPKFPGGHAAMGLALRQRAQFDEALASLRQALALCAPGEVVALLIAKEIETTEQLQKRDRKLAALLRGELKPTPAERLDAARLCLEHKRLYVTAARLYGEALSEKPPLADDLKEGHRYNAACAAALAGCGQGDGAALDQAERARQRARALEWLRADLAAWSKRAGESNAGERAEAVDTLAHWKEDRDLAGVRDAAELAKLPEGERPAWRALWADVAALLDRLRESK